MFTVGSVSWHYQSALGQRYRLTFGRYVGWVAVNTWLTYWRSVGRISAECRSSIGRYVSRYSTDTRSMQHLTRYLTDTRQISFFWEFKYRPIVSVIYWKTIGELSASYQLTIGELSASYRSTIVDRQVVFDVALWWYSKSIRCGGTVKQVVVIHG